MTEPTRRLVSWMARVAVALFLSLLIVIGWTIPATSKGTSGQSGAHLSESPFYQATQTPTPSATPTPAPTLPLTLSSSSFQMTLEELGYGEKVLDSPWGVARYSFRLPDNWLVEPDSYFDLDFSYFYTELGRAQDVPEFSFLGELLVYVDGHLLQVYSLDVSDLEHVHLRIDLPPELFNDQPGAYHTISLYLDAWFLCNVPHRAQLIVHPESVLYLAYGQLPLSLDLGDYPQPFYQRSFDPDRVRFVLPAEPSEVEISEATGIAAELGKLTANRMVISATSDLDWLNLVETAQTEPEHLFVVGRPGRNKLIPWLNDNTILPVSIRRREMALSTQGPVAVAPGDVLSYTITVTNTTSVSSSLSVTDMLPRQTESVACSHSCVETGDGMVQWSLASLSPGEVAVFSLSLRLTDTVQVSTLENTVVLASDGAQSLLNVNTLTTTIDSTQRGEMQTVSSTSRDEYFFVQDGQPVPEEDGILQEIVSPWDPTRAILLITGASDQAVYKAGQALSLETHFPSMKGPSALVREIRPLPPITETLATDLTLADLEAGNKVIYGAYSQEVVYWFHVPLGWQLTNDAYFKLLFSHSEAIDYRNSTLTVLLNKSPLADVTLDKDNAHEGILEVKLPDSHISHGTGNRLSIQVQMQVLEEECVRIDPEQVWLAISQDSLLHLDHRVQGNPTLDLDYFPFPFDGQPDLSDILFVIPPTPGTAELESMFRLAATLGDATSAAGFRPAVSMGDALGDETLSRYHIIAIGRPSVNPLIQKVNSRLPQPFVVGTDEVEEQVGEVFFRLPPDTSLGYIQEIPSPWNERRAFLAVTGTADEGVFWAARALTSQPVWRLSGNLALIREGGEEAQSIDTRALTSSGLASVVVTEVPEFTPVATITSTPQSGVGGSAPVTPAPLSTGTTEDKNGWPAWLMPLIGGTVIVVLVIVGVGVWQSRRQRG
jgi:uncharacterized repeat protein (TIGR01451 family)